MRWEHARLLLYATYADYSWFALHVKWETGNRLSISASNIWSSHVSQVGLSIFPFFRTRSTYWMSFASYDECMNLHSPSISLPLLVIYSISIQHPKMEIRRPTQITDVLITQQKCCLCYYAFGLFDAKFCSEVSSHPINVLHNDFCMDQQFYDMVSHYHCISIEKQKLSKENSNECWIKQKIKLVCFFACISYTFIFSVFFYGFLFCNQPESHFCARLCLLTFHCWKRFCECMSTWQMMASVGGTVSERTLIMWEFSAFFAVWVCVLKFTHSYIHLH